MLKNLRKKLIPLSVPLALTPLIALSATTAQEGSTVKRYEFDDRSFTSYEEATNYFLKQNINNIQRKQVVGDVNDAITDATFNLLNKNKLPDFDPVKIQIAYADASGALTNSVDLAANSYANPGLAQLKYTYSGAKQSWFERPDAEKAALGEIKNEVLYTKDILKPLSAANEKITVNLTNANDIKNLKSEVQSAFAGKPTVYGSSINASGVVSQTNTGWNRGYVFTGDDGKKTKILKQKIALQDFWNMTNDPFTGLKKGGGYGLKMDGVENLSKLPFPAYHYYDRWTARDDSGKEVQFGFYDNGSPYLDLEYVGPGVESLYSQAAAYEDFANYAFMQIQRRLKESFVGTFVPQVKWISKELYDRVLSETAYWGKDPVLKSKSVYVNGKQKTQLVIEFLTYPYGTFKVDLNFDDPQFLIDNYFESYLKEWPELQVPSVIGIENSSTYEQMTKILLKNKDKKPEKTPIFKPDIKLGYFYNDRLMFTQQIKNNSDLESVSFTDEINANTSYKLNDLNLLNDFWNAKTYTQIYDFLVKNAGQINALDEREYSARAEDDEIRQIISAMNKKYKVALEQQKLPANNELQEWFKEFNYDPKEKWLSFGVYWNIDKNYNIYARENFNFSLTALENNQLVDNKLKSKIIFSGSVTNLDKLKGTIAPKVAQTWIFYDNHGREVLDQNAETASELDSSPYDKIDLVENNIQSRANIKNINDHKGVVDPYKIYVETNKKISPFINSVTFIYQFEINGMTKYFLTYDDLYAYARFYVVQKIIQSS